MVLEFGCWDSELRFDDGGACEVSEGVEELSRPRGKPAKARGAERAEIRGAKVE